MRGILKGVLSIPQCTFHDVTCVKNCTPRSNYSERILRYLCHLNLYSPDVCQSMCLLVIELLNFWTIFYSVTKTDDNKHRFIC